MIAKFTKGVSQSSAYLAIDGNESTTATAKGNGRKVWRVNFGSDLSIKKISVLLKTYPGRYNLNVRSSTSSWKWCNGINIGDQAEKRLTYTCGHLKKVQYVDILFNNYRPLRIIEFTVFHEDV